MKRIKRKVSQKSQKSHAKKDMRKVRILRNLTILTILSANFYTCGMASRGTSKKEEPEKEKPACSIIEQAGVPKDRVIGLSIDRKGLFYLLTLESIGCVSTEDVDDIINEDFTRSTGIGSRNVLNACSLGIVNRYRQRSGQR